MKSFRSIKLKDEFLRILPLCVVLTGGVDTTSEGGVDRVEFVNSKHAILPDSVVLLLQHVSTVQKPAEVGSYCLDSKEMWN